MERANGCNQLRITGVKLIPKWLNFFRVVVLSGSMEPAYFRGDILFLSNWDEPVLSGDVIVYKLWG